MISLLILNNPTNPTGAVYSEEELNDLSLIKDIDNLKTYLGSFDGLVSKYTLNCKPQINQLSTLTL